MNGVALSAVVTLVAALIPLVFGAGTLGPRTARLRQDATADLQVIKQLPVAHGLRVPLFRSVEERLADLAVRELVPLDAPFVLSLVIIELIAVLLLVSAPLNRAAEIFYVAGACLYFAGLIPLSWYIARLRQVRSRQLWAVVRRHSSGSLRLQVPRFEFKLRPAIRMVRDGAKRQHLNALTVQSDHIYGQI